MAWLPEERVLFTGDLLFVGLTPLVFAGSLEGALRALDWIPGLRGGRGRSGTRPGYGRTGTCPRPYSREATSGTTG